MIYEKYDKETKKWIEITEKEYNECYAYRKIYYWYQDILNDTLEAFMDMYVSKYNTEFKEEQKVLNINLKSVLDFIDNETKNMVSPSFTRRREQ